MPRERRPFFTAARGTLVAALAAAPAMAADLPAPGGDPEAGLALAERWCASCHVVAPGMPGGDAGPPFATLSAVEVRSDAALRGWLFDPHDPMPDMDLAPAQIEDIIAHIRALEP
jgi:mono/diheme cytochrome c family protein